LRQRLGGLLLSIVLVFVAPSCGHRSEQGSAILVPGVNGQIVTLRVGQEFSYDEVFLRNVIDDPITLLSARLVAKKGLGTVIQPLKVVAAPIDASDSTTTPGGLWRSFPPTVQVSGSCVAQKIEPLGGFTLEPHRDARLIWLMKPTGTGEFATSGVSVTYRQNGAVRTQFLPYELRVHMTPSRTQLTTTDIERACASLGNLLSS
jgi:hypothetical protein